MKFSWNTFVVLGLFVAAKSSTVLGAAEKLNESRSNKCAENSYQNDPEIFSKLDGYSFKLYTSVVSGKNVIVKFDPVGNNSIVARATDDGECCRTIHIESGEAYNTFDTSVDADCSRKIRGHSGQVKLITSNEATDGSQCIILWSCRKAKNAVHAVCNQREVSQQQTQWIRQQFGMMRLKAYEVKQTTQCTEKCFKN